MCPIQFSEWAHIHPVGSFAICRCLTNWMMNCALPWPVPNPVVITLKLPTSDTQGAHHTQHHTKCSFLHEKKNTFLLLTWDSLCYLFWLRYGIVSNLILYTRTHRFLHPKIVYHLITNSMVSTFWLDGLYELKKATPYGGLSERVTRNNLIGFA